jgi:hypothetical protein
LANEINRWKDWKSLENVKIARGISFDSGWIISEEFAVAEFVNWVTVAVNHV